MPVDKPTGISLIRSGTQMKPVLIVQNCPAESAGTIIDYLSSRELPYQEIHSYTGDRFPRVEDCSAVICLGCPTSVNDYHDHRYLADLYSFVAQVVRADVPYLGVCYGGQLLAKVLGASVKANHVKEIGVYKVRLTEAGKTDPLLAPLGNSFPVMQWHGDTFGRPYGCELLAEGTDCTNQAFRHGRQVALQFHLEATESLVHSWCEAYPQEPADVEKTVPELLREFRSVADTVKQLNFVFLDSYFTGVKENQFNNHTLQARPNRSR